MRIIVFFDLPTETNEDKKAYRKFRKALLKDGFIMMQESVYTKLMTTPSVEISVRKLIYNNKPEKGIVQSLIVTEKQFSKIEYIVGKNISETIDSEEKLVIL